MTELPSGPADSYALGRSEAETRRLIVQHQLYGPFTRQFLIAADTNGEILEVARTRVEAAGWANVALRAGDVMELELDRGFDAMVGRWVLQYTPDPIPRRTACGPRSPARTGSSCSRPSWEPGRAPEPAGYDPVSPATTTLTGRATAGSASPAERRPLVRTGCGRRRSGRR
jgi:hypothetical protein